MATVGLSLASACGSGGHVSIAMTINGVSKGSYHFEADELLTDVTDDEIAAAIKTILRIYKIGKTKAVVRTALIAGITVAI